MPAGVAGCGRSQKWGSEEHPGQDLNKKAGAAWDGDQGGPDGTVQVKREWKDSCRHLRVWDEEPETAATQLTVLETRGDLPGGAQIRGRNRGK